MGRGGGKDGKEGRRREGVKMMICCGCLQGNEGGREEEEAIKTHLCIPPKEGNGISPEDGSRRRRRRG
jgi:hypothetical protein